MVEGLAGLGSMTLVILGLWPWSLRRSGRTVELGPQRLAYLAPLLGCVLAGVVAHSPLLILVVPLAGVLGRFLVGRRTRSRRRRQTEEVIPLILDAAVQKLGAGASLQSALTEALSESQISRSEPSVAQALAGMAGGSRMDTELTRTARELGTDWAHLLATTVAVLGQTGGPRTAALERLADTLRVKLAASREASAQSAQAQASAMVLGLLPQGFALMVAIASSEARHLYARTWVGAICVGTSLALSALCWAVFDRTLNGRAI